MSKINITKEELEELYINQELSTRDIANQLDNLICLCHSCHSFVHSNSNIDKLFIKDK